MDAVKALILALFFHVRSIHINIERLVHLIFRVLKVIHGHIGNIVGCRLLACFSVIHCDDASLAKLGELNIALIETNIGNAVVVHSRISKGRRGCKLLVGLSKRAWKGTIGGFRHLMLLLVQLCGLVARILLLRVIRLVHFLALLGRGCIVFLNLVQLGHASLSANIRPNALSLHTLFRDGLLLVLEATALELLRFGELEYRSFWLAYRRCDREVGWELGEFGVLALGRFAVNQFGKLLHDQTWILLVNDRFFSKLERCIELSFCLRILQVLQHFFLFQCKILWCVGCLLLIWVVHLISQHDVRLDRFATSSCNSAQALQSVQNFCYSILMRHSAQIL